MKAAQVRIRELALRGVIITPCTDLEQHGAGWTQFLDTNSGGCRKEPWEGICIQAPESEAKHVFLAVFGHDPLNKSLCKCCDRDYMINPIMIPAFHEIGSPSYLHLKATDILPEWRKAP